MTTPIESAFYDDLYPLCLRICNHDTAVLSSHAKPVVLADRRRTQTDPAGRLEKCGLEICLKVGHLASDNLENSVTKLYHVPVYN